MMCGFGRGKEAVKLKEKIDSLVISIGLQEDTVTSLVDMNVESCDGKYTDSPYLYVRATSQCEIEKIVSALKKNGIQYDLEWDVIGGFIPREKMVPVLSAKSIHADCAEYGSALHMMSKSGLCPSCNKP